MSYIAYRANRLLGNSSERLAEICPDAEWYEVMYRAEQRCNNTPSGFDIACNRLECQRERKCARCA